VLLITDGRFSGATWGACVGHVAPEAFVRGALAKYAALVGPADQGAVCG
jgi:dihydroxyacid dehydratase/phosphogluconate dehydratase